MNMLSNIDIIGKYNSLKNKLLDIITDINSIEYKMMRITQINDNLNILFNDIDINKILTEINNNLSIFVKYSRIKCENKIIAVIKKYINYSKNKILCDKIKNEIKKNKKYSDFFYKLFDNVEIDNNIFIKNIKIIENITDTNYFSLKKKNNNILFLELFSDNSIEIIINDNDIANIKKNKKFNNNFLII